MEQKFSSLQEACVALLAHQKATHEEGGCPVCCHLIAEDGTVIHSNCNRVLSKVKEG
jgi:tRNA(Arg) A34 adenosine deaminase TadA